jgi:single-strand DNA-binding protein
MNKIIISGYIGRDPEIKYATNGDPVASFSFGVSRQKTKNNDNPGTDWLRVVAFGKVCDTISNYFEKGTGLIIEGHIRTNTYEAQDGTKKYTTDIVMDRFEFLPKGTREPRSDTVKTDTGNGQEPTPPITSGDDDEVPF